jgi:hypothetical protein
MVRLGLKGLGHQMDWTFVNMYGHISAQSRVVAGFQIFKGLLRISIE